MSSETRTNRSTRLVTSAWIAILALTGTFQFYRLALADAIVFCALALALVLGETGILAVLDGRMLRPRRLFVATAASLDAIVLIFTPRHGHADGIALAVSGILVLLVAWPVGDADQSQAPWTARLTRAAIAWAILGIAFCIWELAMYFLGYGAVGRTEYPALSDIIDPVLNNPVGRVVGAAAWLAGGVALMRRGRASA